MIENQQDELAQLMDMMFRRQLSFTQKLAEEEARLRQDLARLNNAGAEGMSDLSQHDGMRAIGADLLWQAWLIRQKIEVNTRLADVLVKKEMAAADLRTAFGKSQVASAIRDQFQAEAHQNRQKRDIAI
jgi:hypothetical protein